MRCTAGCRPPTGAVGRRKTLASGGPFGYARQLLEANHGGQIMPLTCSIIAAAAAEAA
jgi:hypothetical protein